MNPNKLARICSPLIILLLLVSMAATAAAERGINREPDSRDHSTGRSDSDFLDETFGNLNGNLRQIAFKEEDYSLEDNGREQFPPPVFDELVGMTASRLRTEPETFGSDYMKRTIIVHDDRSTYFDELLYTAAVPAAVHWENITRHSCLLGFDTRNRDMGILHGDWAGYLNQTGGAEHLDFLGQVPSERRTEISGYYGDPGDIEVVTEADSLYNASAHVASYYWGSERTRNARTAVIAYAPESDGGVQVENVHTNTSNANEYFNVTLNATRTAWLSANLEWKDPNDNTVYDVSLKDPYSTHHSSYNTHSNWYQLDPSNNLVFDHEGSREAGLSPMYSIMPFEGGGELETADFSGTVGASDGSGVPQSPYNDCKKHTIGPVKKGELVECILSWPGSSDLEVYVHPNGTTPDQYLFYGWWSQPQICRFPSERDGYWDVTIHTYTGSGDSYELNTSWGFLPEKSWHVHQFKDSDDQYTINVSETRTIDDSVTESAANAAALASLMDAPMLYTAGGEPEECLLEAMQSLGIVDVILVDPAGMIDSKAWEDAGLSVEHLSNDSNVFNHIADIGYGKTGERDVVVPALGGPWFAAAALEGAAHAAPVPAPNDPQVLSATNLSTIVWWNMIEHAVMRGGSSYHEDTVPSRTDMEAMADDFYSWLGGFHPDYDPSCNDADSDGIPDNGSAWNYSADVDVVVVSPMNCIKMCLDRALIGKGSVGRIPEPDPAVSTAIAARAVLYWKIAFSPGKNPDDATAQEESAGFWDRAGWTFVAYTHDDGIMDDDLGDDVDDDYCEMEDGGANHLAYKMSEELPQYATDHGVGSNEYNTDYANLMNMLEEGVGFYTHADHGQYNQRMETGAGGLGLSSKANPWRDWNDGASMNDPDGAGDTAGLSNPSALDHISGWDLYCGLHDLPSTLIYLQDCQVGASHMPGILLRMGAAGVVGDHYSMYIDPSPVYNDRLVKGLMAGMDYGQANRWAVDEASAVYSMHDPAPPDGGGMALGYSVQCTLYGDPEIVLARPTLRPFVTWEFPESGTCNITFNVLVLDQNGDPYPCTVNASVGGMKLIECEGDMGIGLHAFNWSVSGPDAAVLSLVMEEPGYFDREYNNTIRKDFTIDMPSIKGSITDLQYTGGFAQELNISLEANFETPVRSILNDTAAGLARADIYHSNGSYTGIGSDLSFSDDVWRYGVNISSLPSGDYYSEINIWTPHYPPLKLQTEQFTVSHVISVESPQVVYEGGLVQEYSVLGVTAVGSRLGPLNGDNINDASFQVIYENGTPLGSFIPLEYIGGYWEARNISASGLSTGTYRVLVNISDGEVSGTSLSHQWSVEHFMEASSARVSCRVDESPIIDIMNVTLNSTSGGFGPVPPYSVIMSNFDVIDLSTNVSVLNGSLESTGGEWEARDIDATSVPAGTFFARCTFAVSGNDPVSSDSDRFAVEHALSYSGDPHVLYRGGFIQEINVQNITVGSSFNGSLDLGNISVESAEFEIQYNNGTATGISGPLVEGNRTWHAMNVDVSELPQASFFVYCRFKAAGAQEIEIASGNFTVRHQLRFTDIGIVSYDIVGGLLDIQDVSVECSRYGFDPKDVRMGFIVYDASGVSAGIAGELFLKEGDLFGTDGIDVSALAVGDYKIKLAATAGSLAKGADAFGLEFKVTGNVVIGEFEIVISNGTLRKTSVGVTSNIQGMERPGMNDTSSFTFRVVYANGTPAGISGEMNWSEGIWWLPETDVSILAEGDYYVVVEMRLKDGTAMERASRTFKVEDLDPEDDDDDLGREDDDDEKSEGGFWKTIRNKTNLQIAAIIGILILVIVIIGLTLAIRRRKRVVAVRPKVEETVDDGDDDLSFEDEDVGDGDEDIWDGEEGEDEGRGDGEIGLAAPSKNRKHGGRYRDYEDVPVRGRYSEEVGEDGWLEMDDDDEDIDDESEEYDEYDDDEYDEYDDDEYDDYEDEYEDDEFDGAEFFEIDE